MVASTEFRYTLERYQGRSTRYTCPDCGHQHTFTRWIDNQTGQHLPEEFGICNRADQCGYQLSPYQKDSAGESYALQIARGDKGQHGDISVAIRKPRPLVDLQPQPIYSLPQELRHQSLGQYGQNQFARLLQEHFGKGETNELLAAFQIGTSSYWPGATVFWFIDELGRTRGGQVVLFEQDGHTAKRPGPGATIQRCTRWVHTALLERYRRRGEGCPDWLNTYAQHGQKAACLFGLPQLAKAPKQKPVALVEAPKTAVLCSRYMPQFIWLAVGAKSWLNADRLRSIKDRAITLFPDGGAYNDWHQKASSLQAEGFQINISDYLERNATPQQLEKGYDLADIILEEWPGYPPGWD